MAREMRSDADLLNTLLNEGPIILDRVTRHAAALSTKVIAHWTDRSIQTVSDYKNGKLNIPVDFWRRVLEHHMDERITALIVPDTCEFELVATDTLDPTTGPQWFREAIQGEGEHHEQQKYLAEILADGRVDELDTASVQGYHDAYHRHRQRDAALHRAIIRQYQRALARKEAT